MRYPILLMGLLLGNVAAAAQWEILYMDTGSEPTDTARFDTRAECEAALKRIEKAAVCVEYEPLPPAWTSGRETDEFTGEKRVWADATGRKRDRWGGTTLHRLGIECRDGAFSLTFSSGVVAAPSSEVILYVKVDDDEPFRFDARLYRNSYESGYVDIPVAHPIVEQMKAGRLARIRVDAQTEIVDWSVSLRGFTASSKQVLSACQ